MLVFNSLFEMECFVFNCL